MPLGAGKLLLEDVKFAEARISAIEEQALKQKQTESHPQNPIELLVILVEAESREFGLLHLLNLVHNLRQAKLSIRRADICTIALISNLL